MPKKKSPNSVRLRNSTAEFLTFAYQTGGDGVDVRVQDGTIWLSQKNMGLLFDTTPENVLMHLKNIFAEQELAEDSVAKVFLATAAAKVQNKMHYAVHGHTAAELIVRRADHTKERMGLTTWVKAPGGKILKSDVVVAKNYLTEAELADLGRIVNAYLDLAESRAKRRVPMTMEDWAKRLDIFLAADEREVLRDAGRISAEIAREHAKVEFEKYRVIQDRLFQSDFDTFAALEKGDEDKGDA
jgi:hypothetical protein